MRRVLAAAIAMLATGAGVLAADLTPSNTAPLPVLARPSPMFVSEVRLGASAQDPSGPESGSVNLTGEILSVRPFTVADPILSLLVPRVHLGGSLNLDGRTSFGYAGLTWTLDVTPNVFVEGSFGGAVHDGENNPVERHRNALGCTVLFRESGSLGIRVTTNWSVMATVEHLSNAGLCSNNRGLTNVGVRVGYSF
jgi:lipid A 3-O-deacylase